MDISLAPRGAAKAQGHVVHGGGQLPGDRGVGQGRAAAKPSPLGLLQMGHLACTLEQLRGQQL